MGKLLLKKVVNGKLRFFFVYFNALNNLFFHYILTFYFNKHKKKLKKNKIAYIAKIALKHLKSFYFY